MVARKETKNEVVNGRFKIKVLKNGPYLVSGGIPIAKQIIGADNKEFSIRWCEGDKYPLQEKYSLCRCGQSKKQPFCDGTHLKTNFDGSETANQDLYIQKAKEFDGPTLKLTDNEKLCASARFCHRASGIWKLTSQSDNLESRKIAIEEAGNCPSGTLVIWDKKTGKAIEPEYEQSIGLVEDPQIGVSGPIWVRGHIPIESANSTIYEIRNSVTLCRCGKSTNKPFCDSSHYPE